MSFHYSDHLPFILSEEGSREFVAVRDSFLESVRGTGAAKAGHIFKHRRGGDSAQTSAFVERMIELGDLRYVEGTEGRVWQDRIVEVVR